MKKLAITISVIAVSQELCARNRKEPDLSNFCANYIHICIIPDTEELSGSHLLPQGHL